MWTKLEKPHGNFKSASSTETLEPFATFTDGCGFLQAVHDDNCVVLFASSPNGYKASPWVPPEVGAAIWGQPQSEAQILWDVDVTVPQLANLEKGVRSLFDVLVASWLMPTKPVFGREHVRCGTLKAYNDPTDGNGRIEVVLRFPLTKPAGAKDKEAP